MTEEESAQKFSQDLDALLRGETLDAPGDTDVLEFARMAIGVDLSRDSRIRDKLRTELLRKHHARQIAFNGIPWLQAGFAAAAVLIAAMLPFRRIFMRHSVEPGISGPLRPGVSRVALMPKTSSPPPRDIAKIEATPISEDASQVSAMLSPLNGKVLVDLRPGQTSGLPSQATQQDIFTAARGVWRTTTHSRKVRWNLEGSVFILESRQVAIGDIFNVVMISRSSRIE